MLYYPQLSTGAVACYPLTKTVSRRSAVNRMADGSMLKLADPDAYSIRWELRYEGLNDAERAALESFFLEAEGRLRTFTFFDPSGNLLADSDNPSEWLVDGLLSVAAREETHDGATVLRATNGSQTWQGLGQAVGGPGRFMWCFSAEVRCPTGADVRMRLSSAEGSMESTLRAGPDWGTAWCGGSIPGDAEEITCRLEVEAGATVDVAGLRLQAQPMPGAYKRTTGSSGVFDKTRFDDDRLVFTAEGPDNHSTIVRLVSRG